MRKLCEQKEVGIVEAEVCPDHIHMLLDTAKDERVRSDRVSERKKLADDL